MKTIKIVLSLLFILGFSYNSEAQFLKKLQKHAKEKIKREAERRSERRVDKQIDKEFDDAEDMIDGKDKNKSNKKENKRNKKQDNTQEDVENNNTSSSKKANNEKQESKLVWSSFDFVPGDTVIFEDGPSIDEENGEFPSRWDLQKGQVEIAEVDSEPVMIFLDGSPTIIPYLKNSKEDYLPEIFTIEFDFYKPKDGDRISVYLYDVKNQANILNKDKGEGNMYMNIDGKGVRMNLNYSEFIDGFDPNFNEYATSREARWIHMSIAFTKGKLKVYMDQTRVINIPHFSGNPKGLTLQAYWANAGDKKAFYFKNVRIAKGGVKYYDRVLSEGKIIVNGIKFDINKATLKPESMGPINKIYKMMVKKPDLKFSVEGHTDSDGNDATNMALSKKRGKAVMDKLIAMGIDKSRLKYNGFGESKPIDNNATPEGKANNRRVEFVKF